MANIKKLITAPVEKPKKTSKRIFEMHVARAKALQDLVAGVALGELTKADVRNSLEHFDEHLDRLNSSLASGEKPPAPMVAYNMACSAWEVTTPRVYPIRLYISAEKKYYNMDQSVDLGKVHDQAVAILTRLRESGILRNVESPGGLMMPLP